MNKLVRKAVVLAAGRGKRMGALTDDLPKPMLPVGGKPMLWYILEELRGAGVVECALVVGYRQEVIRNYFRDYDFPISWVVQDQPNGTAAAARLARGIVAAEPFLLTFGDILSDSSDYLGICGGLTESVSAVTAVRRVDDPWRGAAVYERDGEVTRIIEKPPRGSSTTPWTSAGIYAFQPEIFDELDTVPLSPRGEYELTSAVAQLLEKGKRVRVFEMKNVWRDVGTPEDLDAARNLVEKLRQQ